MIYIYLTFFIFISLLHRKIQIKFRYILLFNIFTLFIFVSLRYEVGCDWATYEGLFYNIVEYEWFNLLGHRDPFFWLINGLLNKLNFSFLALNIVFNGIFFLEFTNLQNFNLTH